MQSGFSVTRFLAGLSLPAMLATAALLAGCALLPSQPAPPMPESLSDWSVRELPVKRATHYSLSKRSGQACVLAQANRSVSLWRRKLNVRPDELASIEFSWWVTNMIEGASVAEPSSDDASARMVLAFEGDEAKLSPRNRMLFELARTLTGEAPPYATLMYVWDSKAPVGTEIISARSDRMRKIVVASGSDQLGSWRRFERDVMADYRRVFGEAPGALVGLALMTDADNTQGRTEACYGPIRLKGHGGHVLPGGLAPP